MNEGPDRLTYLRPEVQAFAEEMERRLREKDEERGNNSWKGEAPEYLAELLEDHFSQLMDSIVYDHKKDPALAKKKAIDVANLAMMIWDVSR